MGAFVLIFGGLFWIWKWIQYQVEEDADRRHGAIEDSYYKKMCGAEKREEDREIEKILCSETKTRIKFMEENILDDITEFYGDEWREVFSNIESDDCIRQINFTPEPLGIARMFLSSKRGIEPFIINRYNLYNFRGYKKEIDKIKMIHMYKIYERNMQKFYPEIYLVYTPGSKFNTYSREYMISDNIYDGKLWWNFSAPCPCRKWHPKIKTLDELLSDITDVDIEHKT